jgi:hypothetical protein
MRTRSLALALIFASVTLCATTVVPASVERLTAQSTHVALARALDNRALWDASHSRIYTLTRFQPLRQMKGSLPATFTVKRLGGHLDGYNMKVSGVRGWEPGDDAVLFLRPQADGNFIVTGLMQGDFRVTRSASGTLMVSNGVRGARQLEASGEVNDFQGSRMSLADLEQRVRKAAAR